MHVENRAGRFRLCSKSFDDDRTHRDRGHELTVHHIDMNHARSGIGHARNLLAQARKVGRENRWGNSDAVWNHGHGHTSLSMLTPHWLHFIGPPELIRAMVPCSPQEGHTEVSS